MLGRALTYQPQQQAPFLSIILNKPTFFVDEYITGNVELNAANQIVLNDIYLTFNLSENWKSRNEENVDIGDVNNECLLGMYLDIKRKLNINTSLVNLSPGKFTFPFYFKIPKPVMACFEYPTMETSAYIRYNLNAQIVSPYIRGTAFNYILLASRPIIQKKELSFTSSSNVHKWGLFNGGSTTLKITIQNGYDSFKIGEDINIDIEVDNTKGKLVAEECKFTLNRILCLKSKYGKLVREIKNDCISQKVKTVTKINEKKNFSAIISLKDINNNIFNLTNIKLPYTNIKDINYFLPSINSLLLECKYQLKGTLYFSAFVKYDERPRIIIPIHICHQTVNEFNTEVDNYYRTQNQNQNQINNTQYNINNQQQNNYNRSNSLMNPNYPPPLNINQNIDNKVEDDLDLPTQEEIETKIEKPHENENQNTGDATYDAPAPVFQSNMNPNNINGY